MTLKLISVRIPESMHTYIKVKAAEEGKTFQEVTNEALSFFQKNDISYQQQLHQSVTDSLAALASITQDGEVSRGV
ncbi:hypothetical protein ENHY17A_110097 [Moraxellaceae bacterium 17A]|nr:hypothetical protein ENHY17A_110097 [Moraxellaceae bacterium 17A]